MSQTWIGEHPNDGREYDCQCARCGSSMEWDECEMCGGEGMDDHDCGEDCCACADPEPNVPCQWCDGQGGRLCCLSGFEWCEANPLPGREDKTRNTPEWYVVERDEEKA